MNGRCARPAQRPTRITSSARCWKQAILRGRWRRCWRRRAKWKTERERIASMSDLAGRQHCRIEPGDAAVGSDDEGQRKSIPVAVVERLPGLAVVAADVGAVGSDGNPELEALGPLDGGAEA